MDSWPNVTYIPAGMFFLFSKSCYTEDILKNYKSLNCNLNFANGWVQDVFIQNCGEKRLLIAKVGYRDCKTLIATCACDHTDYQVCPSCCSCLQESSAPSSFPSLFYL